MMIRKTFPLLFLTLLPLAATAQKLETANTTVDVGRTGYQMPTTATFEFKNKSHRHLKISEVRPDCSCTSIEFPKEQIAAGDKFQIKMTYDARQLGHFDHQAAIISNASNKPLYIRMKGVVLAEYQDFSGTYPIEMGDLRLDRDALEFDDVNKGFEQVQELHVYNNGTQVYQPNLMHLPSYMSAVVVPERLAPNRAGKITVTLHSDKLHDYGLTQTAVYLAGNPGDKVSPDHEISVKAVFQTYQMEYPNYRFRCTCRASRRHFGTKLPNHQLHTVSKACGFDLENHHHALADAEACAYIAMKLL